MSSPTARSSPWRNEPNVNGFMALKGGTLEGTDAIASDRENAQFEFKVAGVSQGICAGTDKTIYRVDVPDDEVEIIFTRATHGLQAPGAEADSPNEPVRLRLRGLHAMNAPPKDGDELKDFCAFHTLLEPPVETSSSHIRQDLLQGAAAPTGRRSMPSPGFFCDGKYVLGETDHESTHATSTRPRDRHRRASVVSALRRTPSSRSIRRRQAQPRPSGSRSSRTTTPPRPGTGVQLRRRELHQVRLLADRLLQGLRRSMTSTSSSMKHRQARSPGLVSSWHQAMATAPSGRPARHSR